MRHLEGELFLGAAPDVARHLDGAAAHARAQGATQRVVRVKRVRNPDVVALGELDKFVRAASQHGLTVRLAGVRPELLAAHRHRGLPRRGADLPRGRRGESKNSASTSPHPNPALLSRR
ncbi:hypothetical protein [Variovorax sp. HW608]|uniref:hypothetical protein n=1 Tax=Variovorax sp. HW608 TaxID=1034889 RepID=UPI001560EF08|nr:hypothetical protein [Variovorax sp. HW608]